MATKWDAYEEPEDREARFEADRIIGMDLASGPDMTAVYCYRCKSHDCSHAKKELESLRHE